MNPISSANSMPGASSLSGFNDPSQQQSQANLPKPPGKFRQILGGIVGTAGNVFAPGIGGALGSIIGGGSNTTLLGQLQLRQMQAEEQQELQLQTQVYNQQERMQMMSGIMQSKHQTSMAVINNLKS